VDAAALEAAHYLLRPFCLHRIKSEVEVRQFQTQDRLPREGEDQNDVHDAGLNLN
jgi:hypothetical protein